MSGLPSTFVKGFHDEELVRKMEYIPLGKTGISLSKVSIGGATLASFFGELDEPGAIRTIQQAIRSGINYVDTAPWYGQGKSEEILGKALKDVPREAYYIATKIGRYEKEISKQMDYSAKKTRESVEKSLKLLGLPYVDVIQIHDIEFVVSLDPVINEALPELEKIVKEGKARFIGVTGYPLNVLKDCISRAPGRFDCVLAYSRYTMTDNSLLDYLPFFQENNLGIICAAGHALGMLTNDGPQPWHPASDELKSMCKKAADICKENDIELGKLAMYYFTQLAGPSTFLVGMQTEKLLKINLNAYFDGLTPKEQEILDNLMNTIFVKKLNWEGVELRTIFGRG